MPIYEFYCSRCHTVFDFLARTATSKLPDCPRCGRPRLERRPSRFAVARSGSEEIGSEDDARLERAMESLIPEAEAAGDDPVAGAALVRKLYRTAGVPLGDAVEETLRRLESGEDPETVDADLGDATKTKPAVRRRLPPTKDPELHEL